MAGANDGELNPLILQAFEKIDQGVREDRRDLIEEGNEMILRREQQVILEEGYKELNRLKLGRVMGAMAESPVPGGCSFNKCVPKGDLTNFNDRWKWISGEMLPNWTGMDPDLQLQLVQAPLGASLEDLTSIVRSYYFSELLKNMNR